MKVFVSNIQLLISYLFILMSSLIIAQPVTQAEVDQYLKNLPFEMKSIDIPLFPEKYFDITKYGAVGDGLTKNTISIQRAIDDCSKEGGGYVIVPSGFWLTGPFSFKSNVNLHLKKGAMIVFSADHADYPLARIQGKGGYICVNPILGEEVDNIAITGEGIFNGNGQSWRPVKKNKMTAGQWKELISSGGTLNEQKDMWWPSAQAAGGEEYLSKKYVKEMTLEDYRKIKDYYRPHMLYFVNCRNILLDGPTFQNSPNFAVHISKSENAIVHNVKINNEWFAQNGDGLDFSSCKNVLICKCTVNAGDDGICMKSNPSKNSSEAQLQNVVVADCVVYHAHGGFVIGSNTDGGMKNIYVNNCNFSWTDTGLRFKSGRGRGALVEKVYINNIYMKDIKEQAIIFDMYYEDKGAAKTKDPKTDDKMPVFSIIHIDMVICDGASQAVLINGLPESAIKDIDISNSVFITRKGFEAIESEDIRLDNVNLRCTEDTVFSITNGRNISLNKISYDQKLKIFMKLLGDKTDNISLTNTRLESLDKHIEYGQGVSSKAFKIN